MYSNQFWIICIVENYFQVTFLKNVSIHIEKPCALFCSPNGKEQPILVTEKVMDGTSCGPQDVDICANGKCQVSLPKLTITV